MRAFLFIALMATCAVSASAQTALDPTQSGAYPKYPAYLGASCGGIAQTQYGERENSDGTVTGAFRFYTNCNGSGRGAKDVRYLSCWEVTFGPDRYTVLVRDDVLIVHWKQGSPAFSCPSF